MKIRDKETKQWVDVADKDCLTKTCYWPRSDGKIEWLCDWRKVQGCPDCRTERSEG